MNNYDDEMIDDLNDEENEELLENDEFVVALGHFMEMHRPECLIYNPVKLRKMLAAKALLERILEDHLEEGTVVCSVSQLTRQGFLSVEIESFECEDMLEFVTLIKAAETFEFYPKVNGKMQFAISFSQVMIGYREGK